jgi:hypothetical protein
MAQFLFQVAYTGDSGATQVPEHGNVLERIQPLLDACRGSVTGCSYAFGDYITAMKRAEEAGRNYHPPVSTSTAHRA